jgi:ribonuclease HI
VNSFSPGFWQVSQFTTDEEIPKAMNLAYWSDGHCVTNEGPSASAVVFWWNTQVKEVISKLQLTQDLPGRFQFTSSDNTESETPHYQATLPATRIQRHFERAVCYRVVRDSQGYLHPDLWLLHR